MQIHIPPPVVALFMGAVMWFLSTQIAGHVFVLPGQQLVAGVIIVGGVAIDVVSITAFFKHRTSVNPINVDRAKTLVTSGIFRLSRNPMYVGQTMVVLGWGVWLGGVLNLIPLVALVWYLTEFQIKREEKVMAEKFGQSYADYCSRVRRWI